MEKRFVLSMLADFYGPLLTKHRHSILSMYLDEDMSYQEIAEQLSISRQGVHDAIKRAQEQLTHYESVLGLAARYGGIMGEVAVCRSHLSLITATDETEKSLEAAKKSLDNIERMER